MRCDLKGLSGETGCLQFMPSSWESWSKDYFGYIAPQTQINEMYIATLKIQRWINSGASDKAVFLFWNGGDGREKKGINSAGVNYDTAQYARIGLAYLKY